MYNFLCFQNFSKLAHDLANQAKLLELSLWNASLLCAHQKVKSVNKTFSRFKKESRELQITTRSAVENKLQSVTYYALLTIFL